MSGEGYGTNEDLCVIDAELVTPIKAKKKLAKA